MTMAARLRIVFYVALAITVLLMVQGVGNMPTGPQDNRPKPGPTAPPRPTSR
jgi:hypothetical protein